MSGRDDDPVGIPDGTRLFRRIDPSKIVYDRDRSERRPTSQNFQNSKDETSMSVFAENVAAAHLEAPADFLRGRWSGWYLVAVTAAAMRRYGQKVYLDPANQDPDDYHPSHAAVDGPKDAKLRPKLAAEYEWIVGPPNRYVPPE
jgi:hypothetical protein